MISDQLRALLIDDDPGDFQMTKAMITQIEHLDISLDWVASYQEGLDALTADQYDVYIIDYFLEDRSGVDLVREARLKGIRAPLIMLTGRGSHDVDLEAMEAGAADYLVKGQIEPDTLERSIRYALDREEALARLEASEAKHRSMFDHLPIGLFRCGPDGTFMDANAALQRLLGQPDPEALEERYAPSFFVHPDDLETYRIQLQQFGTVRDFESKLRKADGTWLTVRNTARCHRDTSGDVVYVEGAIEDAGGDLWLEPEVRDARRYRAMLSALGGGVVIVDADGAIREISVEVAEMTGLDAGSFLGAPLTSLLAEEDGKAVTNALTSLSDGDAGPATGDWRARTESGDLVSMQVAMVPVPRADGLPAEILVLFSEAESEAEAATPAGAEHD